MISAPSDETVTEGQGQSVTLHCQTSAVPPVAVVWKHNSEPVHDNDVTHITGLYSTSVMSTV